MYFTWSDDASKGCIDNLDLNKKPDLGFDYKWFHLSEQAELVSFDGLVSISMEEEQIKLTTEAYNKLIKDLLLIDDSSLINITKE
nr:MAG TPA: hypothetical protein [Caudoviricetes sp.]